MNMINNGYGYDVAYNHSSILINRTKLLKTTDCEIRLVTNYKITVETPKFIRDFSRKNLKSVFVDNRTGLSLGDWLSTRASELFDAFERSAIKTEINKKMK